MNKRRVVITGMGWVTPLGVQIEDTWQRLLAGHSGVAEITVFDASNFPVRIAAEVKDWSIEALHADGLVDDILSHAAPNLSCHARQTQFTVVAALRAAQAAGLTNLSMDPALLGISLGNGEIMPDFNQLAVAESEAMAADGWDINRFVQHYLSTVPRDIDVVLDPSAALPLIAGMLHAEGPCCNITNACVSSAAAIGRSADMIRSGDVDVMIAGGGHSMIHPFGVTGFHRLSTLSLRNDEPARAARPLTANATDSW